MHQVRTARIDDAATVGAVLADGFHDDPVLSWVFQGADDVRAAKLNALFGFLAPEVDVPLGATFVTDGGCACWTPTPGTDEWPEERSARFDDVLRRACDDADMARLGLLSSTMAEHHPPAPHWYLGTIAVIRSSQGTGVGTALLRHSLAIVDGAGAPAYLESTNVRNVPLYERHGFRATGRIVVPGGPPLTPMWREPAGP
ncbi:MAG TPA: GNAT family N-acetyltransferase [Acidimicrobiales bacterium]|nr:GNAT family N-acetyltransferase [Acidimicrobiales bacterium]